jgi:hypothetical protein
MLTLPWLVTSGIKKMKTAKNGLERPLRRSSKRRLLVPSLLLAQDAVFHSLCPIAYQDDTGFHFGAPGYKPEKRSTLEAILKNHASSEPSPATPRAQNSRPFSIFRKPRCAAGRAR